MEFARRLWNRADGLAEVTPAARNRYVDFLRAASILVVIFGHWLVAAPYLAGDGSLVPGHMLAIAPWTQWLTLGVQVMPIFFLVGGYANAVAWEAASKKGVAYGDWLAARFQRLIAPVIPVLLLWMAIGLGALGVGIPGEKVGLLSQAALVPTWFLSVYVMVGVLVPWTHRAWKRHGFASFAALVAGAVVIDFVSFTSGMRAIGLVNYGFVWLAIHQLGYAWRDGRFKGRLVWSGVAAATLTALIYFGPYPLAMVGVPGDTMSNTSPPSLALLALGICQSGLVLRFEPFARRILDHRRVWTGTVLVNGMIMSVYLWHMTAMIAVYAIGYFVFGGLGLEMTPNTGIWWMTRPVAMGVFSLALIPFVAFAMRFEKPAEAIAAASGRRLVTGASLVCVGLAMIAEGGVVAAQGFRFVPDLLPLLGTGLAGFGPLGRLMGRSGEAAES